MKKYHYFSRGIISAALTLVLTAGLTASANAATDPELEPPIRSTVGLKIVGFDPQVAAQNGYSTTPPLQVQSPQSGAGITPFGGGEPAFGDCGFSYVDMFALSSRKYKITSGFSTIAPAISNYWTVNVVGPAYNHTHYMYNGPLLPWVRSWQNTATGTVRNSGWHSAKASGTVALNNGWICGAMNPIVNELMY